MKTRTLSRLLLLNLFLIPLTCLTNTTFGQDDVVRPTEDRLPARPFEQPRDQNVQSQNTLMNVRFAGWQEASMGQGEKRVGDEIRRNWVMVDANGRFGGKVSPAEGADVNRMNIFLMHMGRLVKQTSLNDQGRFEFNNVRQGAYSLIGWGDRGFFAFGVNILAHNPNAQNPVPSSVNVMAFQNQTTINTDWIRHYASRVNFRVFGRYPMGEGRNDPSSLYGLNGLVLNTPSAAPATSLVSHRVSKTPDGRIVGRVHQLNSLNGRPVDVRTTNVMLLEQDSVVASTTTDNFGVFEFSGVPDGSYGVLAAGVDGVGLIGINVGSSEVMNDVGEFVNEGSDVIDFTMVSTETIGWLSHYAGEVAYRRGLLASKANESNQQAMPYGSGTCPNCGNCAGGCNSCRSAYSNSCCASRGISFEQWQQMGCPCSTQGWRNYFGEGKFLSRAAQEFRRGVQKIDDTFERAFYNESGAGGYYGGNNLNGGCPSCGTNGCNGTCGR